MKTRYVTKATSWWDEDDDFYVPDRQSVTVHEDELYPQPTGLLNHLGEPLYRQEIREPVGFKLERTMPCKKTRKTKKKGR